MARAYKKAVAEANAEALLEGSDNTETNEGDKILFLGWKKTSANM